MTHAKSPAAAGNELLPSGASTPKAAHNAAYEYFYDDLRTHLFHAKASRQPTLPHDPDGVRDLVERHDRLTRFYLDLLNATTGVRRMSGGMMSGGFDMATAGLENNPRCWSPMTPPSSIQLMSTRRPVAVTWSQRLPHARSRLRPGSFASTSAGSPARMSKQLGLITRLMFEAQATLVTAHIPEGELVLQGVDWLDVQMEVGMRNTRMPKSFTPA
jgi:hypothetical protein